MSDLDSAAAATARRLRGQVIAAVATPMTSDGSVDQRVLDCYAAHISDSGVGGVAVWAHTGRGLFLSESGRERVLKTFRAATRGPLVAGAGVPRESEARTVDDQIAETARMAEQAQCAGADVVMVYPVPAFRDCGDRDDLVVRLHQTVAGTVDLPLMGFWLHADAGGYPYGPAALDELLAMPSLLGMKLATLDRAVACQDAIAAIRAAGRVAVTGEDRMFGPSLMWGAESALVGIAAAVPTLTMAVASAWFSGDHRGFIEASAVLDRFAEATFREPIEGYVQRMLWTAVWEGTIPEEAACDPYRPTLPRDERHRVVKRLHQIHSSAPLNRSAP